MKNAGFPLILRLVSGAILVFAVLVFSGLIPKPAAPPEEGQVMGQVVIWGTFSAQGINEVLRTFFPKNVTYIEKEKETFDEKLIEAIAAGSGPDLILLPQDLILKRQRSLYTTSFDIYSERRFRDTFLSQGEIFLRPDGILAFPFYIDPMVMYWNRDTFAQSGIVRPPKSWDEIYELVPVLTKRKDDGTVLEAAISFGEYRNVTHAKDLIAMLILQTGNPLVRVTEEGTLSTLDGFVQLGIPSAEAPLEFYTNFSNPRLEKYYTWNRALPDSQQMFLDQNLAIYFGYASEFFEIQKKNPLLDFDVAEVPQIREGEFDATIGKIYGVAILSTTKNLQSALHVALTLSGSEFSRELTLKTFLPPVHRSLYTERPTDAFRSVFYDSAIISRGWQDPNPEETDRIFREAVESIVSGKNSVGNAVSRMSDELDLLLENTLQVAYAVFGFNR